MDCSHKTNITLQLFLSIVCPSVDWTCSATFAGRTILIAVPTRVDWSVAQKVSDCTPALHQPLASRRASTLVARAAASDTTVKSTPVASLSRNRSNRIEPNRTQNRMRRLRLWPLPLLLLLLLALAALLLCTQTGERRAHNRWPAQTPPHPRRPLSSPCRSASLCRCLSSLPRISPRRCSFSSQCR